MNQAPSEERFDFSYITPNTNVEIYARGEVSQPLKAVTHT